MLNAAFENELKYMIVEALMLDDVAPADIASEEPLFGSGLGLDSIDALELAMAIHKKYGVKIEAGDERNREIFRNVRSLAEHLSAARA